MGEGIRTLTGADRAAASGPWSQILRMSGAGRRFLQVCLAVHCCRSLGAAFQTPNGPPSTLLAARRMPTMWEGWTRTESMGWPVRGLTLAWVESLRP